MSLQSTLAQDTAIEKSKDFDIVIVAGCRSPITKSTRGGFKNFTADQLLSGVLCGLMGRCSVKKETIGDIVVGNVLQPGGGCAMARIVIICLSLVPFLL